MRSSSNNNNSFKKFYKKDKSDGPRSNSKEGYSGKRKSNKFSDKSEDDSGFGFKKKRFNSGKGGFKGNNSRGKFSDRNSSDGKFSGRKEFGKRRNREEFNSEGESGQFRDSFKKKSFGSKRGQYGEGNTGFRKTHSKRTFNDDNRFEDRGDEKKSFRPKRNFNEGGDFKGKRFQKDNFSKNRKFNGRSEHGKKEDYPSTDSEKGFKKNKPEFERKNTHPGHSRAINLRAFEEKDLSFGKKPTKTEPEDQPKEPEITFSKEIENKWQPKNPPRTYFKAKTSSEEEQKHPQKTKGIRKFTSGHNDDTPQKVYAADERGRKRTRIPNDYGAHEFSEDEMPLNKYIAYCDVCGRREAAQLVKEGKVKVNGELVTEPGHRVTEKDQVTLSGKKLKLQENMLYLLLNKPKGFITTTDDPKGRRTVMDLFVNQVNERIYPIGRLDRNTTGILLLTNDGDLAQTLAHPSNEIRKIYQAILDKPLEENDFQKIMDGVTLEDGSAPVDDLAYLDKRNEIGLEIHNGKNRIVRRIFESLGYEVVKLDRVMYAGLTKKDVPRGKWRSLTKQEVINLKHLGKK